MVHNIVVCCQHVWQAAAAAHCSQTSEIVSLDSAPAHVIVSYLLDMVGIKHWIVGVGWPVPAELIMGSGGQSRRDTRRGSRVSVTRGTIAAMLERGWSMLARSLLTIVLPASENYVSLNFQHAALDGNRGIMKQADCSGLILQYFCCFKIAEIAVQCFLYSQQVHAPVMS